MRDFQQLKVWQKAHALTLAIRAHTTSFPPDERWELTKQIRRAAASIGANIAEGCAKESNADFGRYLQIALGSTCELEYHLILARDLGYLKSPQQKQLLPDTVEVKKMLTRFIQFLNARTARVDL